MAKKKTTKKVEDAKKLNAVVSYDGEGELLSDISSSEPLEKKTSKKKTKKVVEKIVEKVLIKKEKIQEKTQKEIYNDILISKEVFTMIYQGTLIYDSIKDRDKILIFKNNGFILNTEIFPYSGLSIKFKK